MDLIPPKTQHDTQENYMKHLVDLLVETTQQSTTYEQLEKETKELFHRIVNNCRHPMLIAAKNKHSTAQIFVYLIGEEGKKSNKHYYDLLFPSGNIAELMVKFGIKSVFHQVTDYLAPLVVEHKIYEVYRSNAIEITNRTSDFIFDILADDNEEPIKISESEYQTVDEKLAEKVTEYIEGVKKLDPVRRYIGVITVSWAHAIQQRKTAHLIPLNP
jgi:hypothetical protein